VDYKVRLVTTKPNYGGRRWWFICPLVRRPPRRSEALSAVRWKVFREPRGLRTHLYVMLGERKESRALLAVMGTDEATIRAAALSNEEAPVRLGARPGLRTRAARSSEGRFPPSPGFPGPGIAFLTATRF
jgi:hypothetical protein